MNSRRLIDAPRSVKQVRLTRKSAARRRGNISIGLLGTGNAPVRRVPFQAFAREALRPTDAHESLAQRTLAFKIGGWRWRAALARSQPLVHCNIAVATARAPLPGWSLIFLGFRIDPRIVAVEAGENQPLVANVEDAFVVLATLEKVLVLR